MAEGIPARLNSMGTRYGARDGRRFGFTVGSAFLLLAIVSWWRGHKLPPIVLAVIGGALIVAALVAPAHLRRVETGWMRLALAMSRVTTPIFMGAIYFLLLTPIGVLRRTFGRSAIARAADSASFWVQRPEGQRRGNLERQF
ncbi:MAG: hypothetical protein H7Z74_16435 [Anaerolineae bacterium]|nr:hypothetical protein [Gemmatimonadaceae bacterium]